MSGVSSACSSVNRDFMKCQTRECPGVMSQPLRGEENGWDAPGPGVSTHAKMQLQLDWSATSLDQAVAGPADCAPVLTASGELYDFQPQHKDMPRWCRKKEPWAPSSKEVWALLSKLEKILNDRSLFASHCTWGGAIGSPPPEAPWYQASSGCPEARRPPTGRMPMTPRTAGGRLDEAGFLKLLRTAGITGSCAGMVDERFAIHQYLKGYSRTGPHGGGVKARIHFDTFREILWAIGSHAARVDMADVARDHESHRNVSMHATLAQEHDDHTASISCRPKTTRFEAESERPGHSSDGMLRRPRTSSLADEKENSLGKSIFPGCKPSVGGMRGFGMGAGPQRNFMKDTLQQIGGWGHPGPAAYGDHKVGMRRPHLGHGKGQVPGHAKHAHFGTAEQRFAVVHTTAAGMHSGIAAELLSNEMQVRDGSMLRKDDKRLKLNLSGLGDMSGLPSDGQLRQARLFIEYMLRKEQLRQQPPPADLVRTATGESFVSTPRGFVRYDHNSVGRMEIQLTATVKEACLTLEQVCSDDGLFLRYCSRGVGVPCVDNKIFNGMLKDLDLLGNARHQVAGNVAEAIFTKVNGRWAKDITLASFNKCLRTIQEYLVFNDLRSLGAGMRSGPPTGVVSFRADLTSERSPCQVLDATSIGQWTCPNQSQNKSKGRILNSETTAQVGPGAYDGMDKDKMISTRRSGGMKGDKGLVFSSAPRPLTDPRGIGSLCSFNGYSFKASVVSPRHAHCGMGIPWSSKQHKAPSTTFSTAPRF